MATYAIGDVQGCFHQLEKLLVDINFDQANDTLWFTGDLVNRGPQSLAVLRFVKQLGDKQKTVLGNHDLHLLAVHYGVRPLSKHDTLDDILSAPDRQELMDWLREQPLLVQDKQLGFVMAHAGIAPPWTITQAENFAHEVEQVLRSATPQQLLSEMYGNEPDIWRDDLSGTSRLRLIINYFTRMRFCYADGRLDLTYKGDIQNKPHDLVLWYDVPARAAAGTKIIFGHFAALNGKTDTPRVFALDTGCVWGNCLTAMRLDDGQLFSVSC